MADYFEESIERHKDHAGKVEDDHLLMVINDYRDLYKPASDPYRDHFSLMRVYEDEAQARGLLVPGGAYAPIGNPKRKIIQKPLKGRQLERTMAARRKKLQELELRAIKAIAPLKSIAPAKRNPVRAFSARAQVESTRARRARRGAMESGRFSAVEKELNRKRRERALRAIGNPKSPEEYESVARILMSHDSADPGLFEQSYSKWQVGNKHGDLLDSFESATRAEVNYRHAGRETESGFADAQAEGVRREILELGN